MVPQHMYIFKEIVSPQQIHEYKLTLSDGPFGPPTSISALQICVLYVK